MYQVFFIVYQLTIKACLGKLLLENCLFQKPQEFFYIN